MNHQFASLTLRFPFRAASLLFFACLLAGGRPHQTTRAQAASLDAWTGAGNTNIARYNHTATLLSNGRVLIAGGYSTTSLTPTSSAELYDPVTGQSNPTGNLGAARAEHSATLLPNGKVLVVLGKSAELYDPVAGGWSNTASPTLEHTSGHTATLLPNGNVLVVGACNNCSATNAEIYDAASGSWKVTAPMIAARLNHTATLLSNGKVLVAGGKSSSQAAEIYDPATDVWTVTGNLKQSHHDHAAIRMLSGKVLAFGGNSTPANSAEVYDPATGKWATTGGLNVGRVGMTASLLADGKVLICGGQASGGIVGTSELYDPATGLWSFADTMETPRADHSALTISNGRVLVLGGRNAKGVTNTVEVLSAPTPSTIGTWTTNPTSGTFRIFHASTLLPNGDVLITGGANPSSGPRLNTAIRFLPNYFGLWDVGGNFRDARKNHAATLLANGEVLITGGDGEGSTFAPVSLSSCELYKSPDAWRVTGSLVTPRRSHTATLLKNGKVLVVGGRNSDIDLSSAELYDPATGRWSSGGQLSIGRSQHTATLLPNGKVLVVGGINRVSPLASVEIYDPDNSTWSTAASLKSARYGHTATLINNGKVLIVGASIELSISSEIYDPVTGQWSDAGRLNHPRMDHAAALLSDGRVIVAGGADNRGLLTSVEIFDPAVNDGAGAWVEATPLKFARSLHSLLLLQDGKVAAICGGDRNTGITVNPAAEIFDPSDTPPTVVPPPVITPVSASTYRGGSLAQESIIAIFGERLSTETVGASSIPLPFELGQVRVDMNGQPAPLFFVSPKQVNCQIPRLPNGGGGPAVITLTRIDTGVTIKANVTLTAIAPGIFSADASGTGLAAAVVFRVKADGEQVYEPAVRFDTAQNRYVAVPIAVSDPREQVFLILYGTGWRFTGFLSNVQVTVGGMGVETIYAGVQGDFVGLDQLNVRLPGSLAGRGEVQIKATFGNIDSNVVTANIK